MTNFFNQNRNILLISLIVFVISMTGMLFFLNGGLNLVQETNKELQTNVIHSLTEDEVSEKENYYTELFKSHESPMIVMKLDGGVEYSNSHYEADTGFSYSDLADKSFFGLIHPEDLPVFLSGFGKVLESSKPVHMVGPFRMTIKSGEYRANMASMYPVLEHEKVTEIGIITKDITENGQNKEKKGKSEAPKEGHEKNKEEIHDDSQDGAEWLFGKKLVMTIIQANLQILSERLLFAQL